VGDLIGRYRKVMCVTLPAYGGPSSFRQPRHSCLAQAPPKPGAGYLDRLMRAVARREFDVVMVAWSLDRLSLSLQHGARPVQEPAALSTGRF
jgi:hypothetical protein